MKVLILYDSVFGNTEKIAMAMQRAIAPKHTVTAVRVRSFTTGMLDDLDLLVVGSPTRAFRPTKAVVSLLKGLSSDALAQGIHTAAFDTRVSVEEVNSKLLSAMVRLFGYAAQPIDKQLTRCKGTPIAQPTWFFVEDKEGPLRAGEEERAAAWIGQLVDRLPMV